MRMKCLVGCGVGFMLISMTMAGDDRLFFKHCVRQDRTVVDTGAVTLRLWPFSASRKTLTADRIAFASVISEDDIVAVASSQALLRHRLIDEARTPLIASKRTPDTFIFVRDTEVTIFPRILLLTPQVSFSAVRKDDFIASIFVDSRTVGEDDTSDPGAIPERLRKLLPTVGTNASGVSGMDEGPPDKRVLITGPLLSADMHGSDVVKGIIPNLAGFWGNNGEKYEVSISRRLGSQLLSRCPVFVLRRMESGLNVSYVIPLHDTGVFSRDSAIVGRIATIGDQNLTSGTRRIAWNQLFGSKLGNIELRDGDVIEYTLIDRVSPFHEAALP